MYPSRRRILVTGGASLGALLLPWKITSAQDANQDPPISTRTRRDGPEDPSHNSLPAGATTKAMLEQRQKDIKKDIEKLFDLATQLKTEVPLVINGKTIAPGTYTLFIDLKPNNWTLIVSNWKAQTQYNPKNTAELWGAYGYTPDKDVVRAPMTITTLPLSSAETGAAFARAPSTANHSTTTRAPKSVLRIIRSSRLPADAASFISTWYAGELGIVPGEDVGFRRQDQMM